jgi:CDP-2,3-bis-(O-geranylgeranyl)-sn-glycerol synthase
VVTYDLLWLAETIYIYLPAYIANATPVILNGGGALDRGRNWVDGKPMLGDHKTVWGTLSGLAAGFLVGLAQRNVVRGVLLAVGAIGGDLIVSFFKRRFDLKPGALLPVADQMGFIVFAVILVSHPCRHPPYPLFDQRLRLAPQAQEHSLVIRRGGASASSPPRSPSG